MREIFLISILIIGWIFAVEPNMLCTKTYGIEFKELAGKKAVLAGDFHFKSKHRVERVIKKINEQHADFVFYTGDYTEKVPADYVIEKLLSVNAPACFVLGNHDMPEDYKSLPNLLNNRHIEKDGITIAGVDYYNPDIEKALSNAKNPVILLSHNPDILPKVPKRVRLILSGHTHGGQVTLFGRPFVTPSKYGFGKGIINNRLVITGGTGTSVVPARLFNPPEITVIEFK